MSDWKSKDRRGFTIVFPQTRWDHVLARGHFDHVKGVFMTVMTTFAESTLILDNEPLGDSRLDGAPRTAHERYVSLMPNTIEQTWLIVPCVVHEVPFTRPGAPTLEPPVRVAQSAYTRTKIPDGNIIWQWAPEEEES